MCVFGVFERFFSFLGPVVRSVLKESFFFNEFLFIDEKRFGQFEQREQHHELGGERVEIGQQ